MSPESDAEAWRRASGGDGRAFAAIFDRHRDRVFRSALRVLDASDAEDAVAITFLEMWRLRARVRLVDGSVLPWLLATSYNVARNHARGRRRYRTFLARVPVGDNARSPEDLTVEQLETFERGRRAAEIFSRLPKSDAELLTLVVVDELSVAQLAALYDITSDAAKQRISRARRRAREIAETNGLGATEGVAP